MKEVMTQMEYIRITERQKKMFKRLLDVADVNSLTKEERIQYESNLKHYRDYVNTIDCAKNEGMEKGIAEGMEKGMAEEKLVVAKSLKTESISLDVIAKCTGLSIPEIERL